MKYQSLPNASLESADIIILPIPHEQTVSGKGGTAGAPQAILEIGDDLEFYEEDAKWSPTKYMKVRVESSLTEYKQITNAITALNIKENQFLISLGGEHSITPQITSSVLDKKSTILFLDAHADMRESYQGSAFSHATPTHHLLDQGHKIVLVGVRSIFENEAIRIAEDKNITFFSDRALQKSKVQEELLSHISNLEGDVYLSIDMDAFDPACVPSVGTPQPGGIDWFLALDILETLFANTNITIKGADIVELIPEASNVSQVFAAKLLQKIISFWGKSQGFDKTEMNGSQMEVKYE
jgi:agmatinase